MICTYIFRDTKLNTLANYSDAGKPKICLRFEPDNIQKSLWNVHEMQDTKRGFQSAGVVGSVKLVGMVVSTHSASLTDGIYEQLVRTRFTDSVSAPVNNSIFVNSRVIQQYEEESGGFPSSFDVKSEYIKPLLVEDGKYSGAEGEESGYYMVSVINLASLYSKDVDEAYKYRRQHLYAPVVEKILDLNHVTHTRYKPFMSLYHTHIYYDPNYLYNSNTSDYKYHDQGFESVCDNAIWEGEDKGFNDSMSCPLPRWYMPLIYVMPNGMVRNIEETALRKLGDNDSFSISTFNLHMNQELTQRVVTVLDHIFGRTLG